MRDLQAVLSNYNINGEITATYEGPMLQIVEFTPKAGTKIRQITSVLDDIRRELGVSSLRAEPVEDSSAIAFEYPLEKMQTIDFSAQIESDLFKENAKKMALPLILGSDVRGKPVMTDLAKMPHLLIGGTTGSGKSVGLNTFILSLMAARKPSELKFVLIDPKKIEFSMYNNQKYMLAPVVTESSEAVAMLAYLAEEMDNRYNLFAENMVKNIAGYNEEASKPLPYIVCVIDEFADLMSTNSEVEKDVMRLAQKARAAGIHLLLATQRPSVDVVTGVLKANFPARLAYKTASAVDSRTILDEPGAESLLGRGDSLFLASNGELKRLHGAYATDEYIENYVKQYHAEIKPLKGLKKENKEEQTKNNKVSTSKETKKPAKKDNIFLKIVKFWKFIPVKYRNQIKEVIIASILIKLGIGDKRRRR